MAAFVQKFSPPLVNKILTSAWHSLRNRTAISGAFTAATLPVTPNKILGRLRFIDIASDDNGDDASGADIIVCGGTTYFVRSGLFFCRFFIPRVCFTTMG